MTPLWLGFVLLNPERLSDAPVGEMPSSLVASEQRVHTKGCLFLFICTKLQLRDGKGGAGGRFYACVPTAAGAVQGDGVGSFPTMQPGH